MHLLSSKLVFLILVATLVAAGPSLADSDCDGCKRAGKLESCTADDPMGIAVPQGSDREDGGNMGHSGGTILSGTKAFCSSMGTLISELMLPECFGLVNREYVESTRETLKQEGRPEGSAVKDYKEPEYSFDIEFVSGLDEYRESDGRPVRSRMKVTMFFDGEQREEVHQWNTVGTWDIQSDGGTTLHGHKNKFRRAYKEGPSITEIIDEFEKRPYDCQMDMERDVVKPGQIIDIELSDFKDAIGETSREFNRVMLQVQHGKILNGMPSKYSDDLRVFRVGKEPIKVKYQAPDSCYASSDSLFINSACDILTDDREPLADTELDDDIQTNAIPLYCPGVYAIMTVTQEKSTDWNKKVRGGVDRKDWRETTSITIRVDFEDEPDEVRQSFDMATMTSAPDRYRFKPAKWTITQSTHNGSGKSLQKRESSVGLEYLLQSSASETATFTNLRPSQESIRLTIDVDPGTGRATSITIPAYDVDLKKQVSKRCQKKERRTVDGDEKLVSEDCSDSWKHSGGVHISAGEDECWEISGGDGINSLSGGCKRWIDHDNGYTELEFKWSVTILTDSK